MKFYGRLFLATFTLSAFTFGGGYVIVPLMRKQFVEKLKWIEEEEMLDLTAIAQSTPGAIAVNASVLIGYRVAGIKGAIVTVVGTVLPPLIILSVISVGYTAFRDNRIVQVVLKAMQAGVAAVILDVVYGMVKDILWERKKLTLLILMTAFLAVFFFKVNVIYLILVSGLLGFVSSLKRAKEDDAS